MKNINTLPAELISKIFLYDNTYKQIYNQIINKLKKNFHPYLCNENCKFNKWSIIEGEIFKIPILSRQTNKKCSTFTCNNSVSVYQHNLCYECCTIYDEPEFSYHHFYCY
jgi:hypothetical protein